jgi:predicted  nucleic acid-binding Zn-ribbon protein
MSQVITLYRLQKIDSQRDRIDARLNEIDHLMTIDLKLKAAQLFYDQALATQTAANEAVRTTEASVSGIQLKIEHNQSAQFGGKIHTPKELQDLQSEQGALERRRSELEDEQISAMVMLEQADIVMKEAETSLQQVQQIAESEKALLRGEKVSMQKELEKANTERQAIFSTIPAELAATYEKLRQQKQGVAVATISDESCTACGSSLTPADCQAARSPSTIKYCPSCGRILYAG